MLKQSPVALQLVYKDSNKAVVGSDVLTHVFDVKLWLASYLEDLHQHTQPQVYRFTLNSKGKTQLHYKKWSHMDWGDQLL